MLSQERSGAAVVEPESRREVRCRVEAGGGPAFRIGRGVEGCPDGKPGLGVAEGAQRESWRLSTARLATSQDRTTARAGERKVESPSAMNERGHVDPSPVFARWSGHRHS